MRKSLAEFFKSFGFPELDANDFVDAYTVNLEEDKPPNFIAAFQFGVFKVGRYLAAYVILAAVDKAN